MKKILSFVLAALLLVSAVPMAHATNDYTAGTAVVYTATSNEAYTVTVPAQLAPGGSGTVTLEGTWASNTLVTVTAQENVVLTNSINAADQKTLDVTFSGISELGSNTESQKFTESVSVENIENAIFGTWNGHFYYTVGTQELDTLEQLQEKYEFTYYSTMNLAVTDVNNGAIGASADSDKGDAVAGIYTDENGGVNVVLLQDHTEATRIKPSVDMTINLGGNVLSSDDAVCIDSISGNVTIDGRLDGSSIELIHSDASAARPIQVRAGNFNVNGGTYISSSNCSIGDSCIYGLGNITVVNAKIIAINTTSGLIKCAETMGTLTMSNCEISVTSTTGTSVGVDAEPGATIKLTDCNITAITTSGRTKCVETSGTLTMSNCELSATSTTGTSFGAYTVSDATMNLTDCNITAISEYRSRGIENFGTATVSNCDIRAYSNYTYSDGEGYYGSSSNGISNSGTLTLNDCYVMGTHSGVSNQGPLYVNGGTYEGYGHGGFYFSGSDNTSYVRDAIIRQCAMPDGYTATANCNGAGFYIGGSNGQDNTVYMDNCDIYGSYQPVVLRGTDGEKNNSLYISNSTISGTMKIRIDNNTHKLYIGAGNNFTVDNTTLPEAVVVTGETYIYNG